MMRKRRKAAIGHEVIAKVEEYFHESASCVPDMKAVNKRTMKSSKVLSEPVSELYVQFKEKNPAIRLSRAQFHKLRPKDVKTRSGQDNALQTALPESMRALQQPEAEAGSPKQGLRP